MKTMTMLFLLMAALFISCNDDNNNYKPDELVNKAFEQKYPEAARVKWEAKANYQVAEFYDQGVEKEAWFDKNGSWYMTESDIAFDALPVAVKTSFKAKYADWNVDDVDQLERAGMETVYVIEAERGKEEMDLYYAQDGTLVKVIVDGGGGEHQPENVLTQAIKDYISRNYAGAKILEAEVENKITEVDILHDGKHKEVKFDQSGAWLSTEWDVLKSDVPPVVLSAITTRYADYTIDDIDFIERAQAVSVYRFELEKGDLDLDVLVDEAGNVLE